MKTLLLITLIIPGLAIAGNPSEDITCALESVHNTYHPGKAGKIIYLRHIGENVFERSHYKAYGRAKNYRTLFGGKINKLELNDENVYELSYNLVLNKNLVLHENTSGGGFPGAGAPPVRGITYKCIEGYSFSQDRTKADIKADFNL